MHASVPSAPVATGVVQLDNLSRLAAPKAQQPPSSIPTQQLADQADDWARGRGASPALPAPKPAYALNPPSAFITTSPAPSSTSDYLQTMSSNFGSPYAQHQPPPPPPPAQHQHHLGLTPLQQSAYYPQQQSSSSRGEYMPMGLPPQGAAAAPPAPPPPVPQPPYYAAPADSHSMPQPPFYAPPQQQPMYHQQQHHQNYYNNNTTPAPYPEQTIHRPSTTTTTTAMQMPNMESLSLHSQSHSVTPSIRTTLPPPTHSMRPSYYSHPEEGPPFKLAVTQPDQKMLGNMRETALAGGGGDWQKKIAWSKQVLKYIERHQANAGESSRITDPSLVRWTDEALKWIMTSASSNQPVALALYLRGDLSSSGSFPSYKQKDTKSAFRDFESAANLGYFKSWFRIGRAYEDHGDVRRAVGAYERGIEKGDCGSTYRLAMAYLLGQIGLVADVGKALALLRRAADTADLDTPQPPYILGMLLSGEFESPAVKINPDMVPLDIEEAKWRIERAAYLNFGPAQYKMGFAYEYATLGCPFDPLLSVQYYALASQNGEVEADMALAKWYLCGSEGHFDKNETLAYTFAEKAASRQLPSAEFALGYFKEVGVNSSIDLDQARRWYTRAANHGNEDAKQRLEALGHGDVNALSRTDHETQVDQKLVRKRTQAQARSNARQQQHQQQQQQQQQQINSYGYDNHSNRQAGMTSQPPSGSGSTTYGAYAAQSSTLRRKDTLKQVQAAAAVASSTNSNQRLSSMNSNHVGSNRTSSGFSMGSNSIPNTVGSRQSYQLSDRPISVTPTTHQMRNSSTQQGQHQPSQPQQGIQMKQKPASFAEMGIATTKAKRDECTIM
ncbi:hypothetical protein OIO90_005565 [Microbotryomycetes sp. JL221]|nr:hypothetical protein OIO90_005565 [Microbotryomycetes sp. JL221]